MTPTLVLILVIAGAYLAAHVLFEWLARRHRIVSGAEYLLLGVLLGPAVSGVIRADVVGGLGPLVTLALGWIGAVVGAQFYIRALIRIPALFFRVAFTEAVLSFVLASAAMSAALVALFGLRVVDAALPAAALGAIATVSAPSGVGVVSRALGRPEAVIRQLEVTTAIDALVAILAFGLLLSVRHVAPEPVPRAPTATEWAVISFGIGIVGGALFHLFLGREQSRDRIFIALAGAVILVSGAAAYLRLSPLLPAMLVGMMLVNTSPNRAVIKEVLARVERPLYFVLLIFAGAAWSPEGAGIFLPVLAFLLVRTASKMTGAAAAGWSNHVVGDLGAGWGRALLGQGGLAVAIALNYRLHETATLQSVVFTAALVSVLLTDLSAVRLAESVVGPLRRRARRGPRGGADDAFASDRGSVARGTAEGRED